MPGSAANLRTSRGKSLRIKGSPPVRRIRFKPKLAKTDTNRSISSKLSQCTGSSKPLKCLGMQQLQRRAQRSVTDNLR